VRNSGRLGRPGSPSPPPPQTAAIQANAMALLCNSARLGARMAWPLPILYPYNIPSFSIPPPPGPPDRTPLRGGRGGAASLLLSIFPEGRGGSHPSFQAIHRSAIRPQNQRLAPEWAAASAAIQVGPIGRGSRQTRPLTVRCGPRSAAERARLEPSLAGRGGSRNGKRGTDGNSPSAAR
jgi:hypothetical protein